MHCDYVQYYLNSRKEAAHLTVNSVGAVVAKGQLPPIVGRSSNGNLTNSLKSISPNTFHFL